VARLSKAGAELIHQATTHSHKLVLSSLAKSCQLHSIDVRTTEVEQSVAGRDFMAAEELRPEPIGTSPHTRMFAPAGVDPLAPTLQPRRTDNRSNAMTTFREGGQIELNYFHGSF